MNNFLVQFGPLILLVGVMYFFFIRPQAKRQREQQAFVDQLEKGQEVVTASGMFGRIVKIEDQIVTLEVDQKTFIRVTKSSVSKDLSAAVQGNSLPGAPCHRKDGFPDWPHSIRDECMRPIQLILRDQCIG